MNTISGPMLPELSKRLIEADRDPEVRVIVLTGNGRAFCAGLDIAAQSSGGGLGNIGASPGEFDLRDAPPIVLHAVDTPTVCSLNGGAAGYGMDIALGCDIRIAAESSKLAAAFTKRGILPESGGTWLLPRMVGYAKAAEIAFTGRTLMAKECLELGLVNQVVPDTQLAGATRRSHSRSRRARRFAVRATKRMMRMAETETFEQNVHHVFLQLLPSSAARTSRRAWPRSSRSAREFKGDRREPGVISLLEGIATASHPPLHDRLDPRRGPGDDHVRRVSRALREQPTTVPLPRPA
jgi:enoyl-CoA hydratase/carnithine racemase